MLVNKDCGVCQQPFSLKRLHSLAEDRNLTPAMLKGTVTCRHCEMTQHLICAALDKEPTTTFYCRPCLLGPLKGVQPTYVLSEAQQPGYMSFANFQLLAAKIASRHTLASGMQRQHVGRGRPTKRHTRKFSFQEVQVVWELFACTSGDSIGLKAAG